MCHFAVSCFCDPTLTFVHLTSCFYHVYRVTFVASLSPEDVSWGVDWTVCIDFGLSWALSYSVCVTSSALTNIGDICRCLSVQACKIWDYYQQLEYSTLFVGMGLLPSLNAMGLK